MINFYKYTCNKFNRILYFIYFYLKKLLFIKLVSPPTKLCFIFVFFSFNFIFASSIIIEGIRVEGNKKIEKSAVIAKIKTKTNAPLDIDQVNQDVIDLFETGFFYDIEVVLKTSDSEQKGFLLYRVVEKPSIAEIIFKGNNAIDDDELLESSKLKNYELQDMNKILSALENIQKLYEDKGYFLAKINYSFEEIVKDESVRLIFDIEENEKVKVKKITILGNKAISDHKIKSLLFTKESGFFSFLSGSGAYKQEAFDRDVQVMRFLYLNEGYIHAKVFRPKVYVTPDKTGIQITIRVEEGDQYFIDEIDFAGDILFPKKELFDLLTIKKDEVFSYGNLQRDLNELQAEYGDLGYAFCNIIPRTVINEEDKKVNLIFDIDKGEKVYFGEINVIGNNSTRDKVIRRELKIYEGEIYNETNKRKSFENIKRLGFFEEVNFKTSTSLEKSNVIDIDIIIKERNTGSIQIGAGYSSSTNFTFQGMVNESNFLGKGQNLGVRLDVHSKGSYYRLNFTEPYFLDSKWSFGFDLYQDITAHDDYEETVTGGSIRFGHPLAEYLHGYLRYKYDDTNIKLRKDMDEELYPVDTVNGITSSITASLVYDERDDRFSPSKGKFMDLSLEYAGIGGDLKYLLGRTSFQYYYKIIWNMVLRNRISYGIISPIDDEDPPFHELFLLGGPYSLRGYYRFQVGQRKFSQKIYDKLEPTLGVEEAEKRAWRPYGGMQQLFYSLELEFPLIPEANIKGVIFFDIGQADDNLWDISFMSDIGFGFRWFSPIGPLRFEWGFPLNRDPIYHEPMVFEFSIGSPF